MLEARVSVVGLDHDRAVRLLFVPSCLPFDARPPVKLHVNDFSKQTKILPGGAGATCSRDPCPILETATTSVLNPIRRCADISLCLSALLPHIPTIGFDLEVSRDIINGCPNLAASVIIFFISLPCFSTHKFCQGALPHRTPLQLELHQSNSFCTSRFATDDDIHDTS